MGTQGLPLPRSTVPSPRREHSLNRAAPAEFDRARSLLQTSSVRALFAIAALLFAGCSADEGVVEWSWVFVDLDGRTIFPTGVFDLGGRDACNLPARANGRSVTYDLGVELSVCDPTCPQGCSDPDCQVIAPLEFDCETHRGSNPAIPSSDEPYQFALAPVLTLEDGSECREVSTCIASPGPRERVVEPGLVTDLQVFQLVVGIVQGASSTDVGALDLEECGCA